MRGPCALPRGSRALVAVSGGADSTSLLVGLCRLAGELGLELHAAHLHHGLRGAEADGDLESVRELCARLHVPLSSARWNTRLRMKRRNLSGQAGLRTLRREFLLATTRRVEAVAVATAHTADDQLETVFLRLLRGTGLAGLGGMSPRRGPWIKPLLEATRSDIEADLMAAGQPWRDDRSNLDRGYARTRVRHDLVPALVRALEPGAELASAREALARRVAATAREARDAERALRTWMSSVPLETVRVRDGEIALDSARVRSYPLALRRALIRRLWKRLAPGGPGLTHRHLLALSGLIERGRGGTRLALPGGLSAIRDGGLVRIHGGRVRPLPEAAPLAIPGRTTWGCCTVDGGWTSGARALESLARKPATEEYFGTEGLEGKVELRIAEADERFVPFGRRRPIRLGRFLSKQGVSHDGRLHPKVLADGGGILWVIGVRRSARAPVTAATGRALRVRTERHD